MPKYQQYFQEMIEYNAELFNQFKAVSEQYKTNPGEHQEELNDVGEKVLRVVRRYENMLCGKSENSGYGKFSSSLSDKFWKEVRTFVPEIDNIGKAIE